MFDLDAIDLWRKSRHRFAQSLALAEQNTQPSRRPVRRFGEKLNGGQIDADLVDHLPPALLANVRPDQARLIAMHIMLAQDLVDGLDPRLDRGLVVGSAVLAQQEF
jgi:hypothetical protein